MCFIIVKFDSYIILYSETYYEPFKMHEMGIELYKHSVLVQHIFIKNNLNIYAKQPMFIIT